MQCSPLIKDRPELCTAIVGKGPWIIDALEEMWLSYHPFADHSFVEDFQRHCDAIRRATEPGPARSLAFHNFSTRYWEMAAACTLIENGVTLIPREAWENKKDNGPDLLATVDGRRVWVECVVPGQGDGQDRVPDIENEGDLSIPEEQIALRVLNPFGDKLKQHGRHLKGGIVKPDDAFVIALNTRSIPWAFIEGNLPPTNITVLYGALGITATFNRATGDVSGPKLVPKPSLPKATGALVPTAVLRSEAHARISGVLLSRTCPWNRRGSLSDDCHYAAHVQPHVHVPLEWLPGVTRWHLSGDGLTLTLNRVDPEPRSLSTSE